MTDRIAGFVVVLDENRHADDAALTISAIEQIKGVISVQPVVGNASLTITGERVRQEITSRIYEALSK